MKSFFWFQGHIGWPMFTALVFSVVWLLAVDFLWRVTPTSIRKFATVAGLVWLAGIVVIIAIART